MKTRYSKFIATATVSLALLLASNVYSAFMNAYVNVYNPGNPAEGWAGGAQVQGVNNDAFFWASYTSGAGSCSGTYQRGWGPIGSSAYHDSPVNWSGTYYYVYHTLDGTYYDRGDLHFDPVTGGFSGFVYAWAN